MARRKASKASVRQVLSGLVSFSLLVGTVSAQSNLGELLDAGGKALTKDEILTDLKGATASGALNGGGETHIEWKDNGTVSGYVVSATGRRGSILGKWEVNDSGKVCRDYEVKFYESTRVKDCFVVYRLGDQYFFPANAATAAEPRATILQKRMLKR